MAYQALYRKYRPQSFEEVVGQKQIVQTLQNAISKERIAHAYLFTGPRGTGKTSIAKIFARTLNCTGEHKPCGECVNCRMAASGNSPDIIEIDAASNNGVDEVRRLVDVIAYPPMHGKYKVYIIDEVHMMTTGAFNALLKTIEEPPEHAIFIFATTEPNKVLPTILSRCQRFDFGRIADEDIISRLRYVCDQENIQADDKALALIANLADGGMRDSLSILDQCVAYSPDKLDENDVREIYGLATPEDIGKIFSLLNPQESSQAIDHLSSIHAQGMDMKRFLSDFIRILKNSLLMDFSPDSDLIRPSEKDLIREYFLKSESQKRIRLLEDLMEAYGKLSYASNILDYIETYLLKNAYEVYPVHTEVVSETRPNLRKPVSQPSENPVQNSDIEKKAPKTSHNHSIADIFWKSDVSRETLNPVSQPEQTIRFDEDFLLSLLVGADKKNKEADKANMQTLSLYMADLGMAKFASSLQRAAITASADTYILFSVPTEMEANQINEFQAKDGYERFTNQILQKPKQVFALDRKHTNHLIQSFKTRNSQHTLPQPYKAHIDLEGLMETEEEDPEVLVKKYFPDVQVVDD